jgi:hypothetical protein
MKMRRKTQLKPSEHRMMVIGLEHCFVCLFVQFALAARMIYVMLKRMQFYVAK